MSQENRNVKTPKYAFVILAVAYLTALASGVLLNKASPILPVIRDAFAVSLGKAGLLASTFSVAGLFLALPSGLIIQRLGLRAIGSTAMGFLVLGSILGALSGSFGFLLFSRILEGMGYVVVGVAVTAAIAMWFPPGKIGASMGIYATSLPIASAFTMSLAPVLEQSIGWRGVWWLSAGICFAGLVLYWYFMRPAPAPEGAQGGVSALAEVAVSPEGPSPFKTVLKSSNMWIIAVVMVVFGMCVMSLTFMYPTYLNEALGMELTKAGLISGVIGFVGLPMSPLGGWISDLIGSRKKVALVGLLFLLVITPITVQASGALVWAVAVVLGTVSGLIPPVMMAAVSDALEDFESVPIGMGLCIMAVNFGMLVATPVFGWMVDKVGWSNTGYIFTVFPLIAIVLLCMYKEKSR